MPQLTEAIQSLDLEAPIDLFKLEGAGLPAFYFTNFGNVVFNGQSYTALPVTFEWIPISSEGASPTSRLTVSDVSGILSGLIESYGGALGATLTATRTYRMFLDNQISSDPTQTHPPVILRVNKRTWEPGSNIELECVSGFDLERKKIPGRAYLKRCQWLLSDSNCQASTAISYDLAGNPTSFANRACGKDTLSCARYHGGFWPSRFGGFIGVQRR